MTHTHAHTLQEHLNRIPRTRTCRKLPGPVLKMWCLAKNTPRQTDRHTLKHSLSSHTHMHTHSRRPLPPSFPPSLSTMNGVSQSNHSRQLAAGNGIGLLKGSLGVKSLGVVLDTGDQEEEKPLRRCFTSASGSHLLSAVITTHHCE